MNCRIVEDTIVIGQSELDIYDAADLREKISSLAAAGNHSLVIDLQGVEEISTPIIQILLSAKQSIENLTITNISEGVSRNLRIFGFYL